MLTFNCYNITGQICSNYAAALWSRDQRALSPQIWGQIYDILESGSMCIERRRRYEMTHTVGRYTILIFYTIISLDFISIFHQVVLIINANKLSM